jgi:hypothetical protein
MKFEGVYTALVTPFKADGAIDWEAFTRLVEAQIAAGVAGIVPVRGPGREAPGRGRLRAQTGAQTEFPLDPP